MEDLNLYFQGNIEEGWHIQEKSRVLFGNFIRDTIKNINSLNNKTRKLELENAELKGKLEGYIIGLKRGKK